MKKWALLLLVVTAFAIHDPNQDEGEPDLGEVDISHLGAPPVLTPEEEQVLERSVMQRRRLAEDLSCMEGDSRGRCEIYDELMAVERNLKSASRVLGDCEYKAPSVALLVRDDETWAYATSNPEKAYNGMMDFLRDQHWLIDDKHKLTVSYEFTTRDRKKRKFLIKNDMDLFSAFQLQSRYDTTQFTVDIHTDGPTAVPTTRTPTSAPTPTDSPTSAPTFTLQSNLMKSQSDINWISTLLDSSTFSYKKVDKLLYRSTTHGYQNNYFHSKVDGKGPFIVIVKAKTSGYIFGAYSANSWASSGGYKQCPQCMIWIAKNRNYTQKYGMVYRYSQYGTYFSGSYGPTFGGGHDFVIFPSSKYGYTNMGHTYKAPNGGYPYYIAVSNTSTFYYDDWECHSVVSSSSR